MRIKIMLVSFLLFLLSCKSNKQEEHELLFDKSKWEVSVENNYPFRGRMLKDVMANYTKRGAERAAILNLLGAPTKIDSGYLFYRIEEQRVGLLTLHTKTLVLKFAEDNTIEWAKIHE